MQRISSALLWLAPQLTILLHYTGSYDTHVSYFSPEQVMHCILSCSTASPLVSNLKGVRARPFNACRLICHSHGDMELVELVVKLKYAG